MYDEGLAEHLRALFADHDRVVEKKMFGGLAFMYSGHMCCGVISDSLMARIGPGNYHDVLALPHVSEMDFTGRPLTGFVYVLPGGIETDEDLQQWLNTCIDFVTTLPEK